MENYLPKNNLLSLLIEDGFLRWDDPETKLC